MARKAIDIKLSLGNINDLNKVIQGSHDSLLVRRCQVILLCNDGKSNKEISGITGMNEVDVGHWRKVYATEGINGLFGKTNGGINQYGAPNREELETRLDQLLSQEGVSWTLDALVKETGSTRSIISGILRKKGITLQRRRQWEIGTQDELVPKTMDIIGLFISKEEQAVILCCSQEELIQCKGELITRNRELFKDFDAYDGTVSLADAIKTAVNHVNDKNGLVPVSLSDFISQTIATFPQNDDFEYHLLIHSSKSEGYKGNDFKCIYQNWADSSEEWLQIGSMLIEDLSDYGQLNAVTDLQDSIGLYIEKSTTETSPLIWRKAPAHQTEPTYASSRNALDSENTSPSPVFGTEHSPFLDELREVIAKHVSQNTLGSNVVRSGFISFAYDENEIRLQIDDDCGLLLNRSDFSLESLDASSRSLSAVESTLIKVREDAGVHAAEMAIDLLKKTESME